MSRSQELVIVITVFGITSTFTTVAIVNSVVGLDIVDIAVDVAVVTMVETPPLTGSGSHFDLSRNFRAQSRPLKSADELRSATRSERSHFPFVGRSECSPTHSAADPVSFHSRR